MKDLLLTNYSWLSGGPDGPDTIKGQAMMFQPAGDRLAVSAYLTANINAAPEIPIGDPYYYEGGLALWGTKLPNPQLWPSGMNSGNGNWDFSVYRSRFIAIDATNHGGQANEQES